VRKPAHFKQIDLQKNAEIIHLTFSFLFRMLSSGGSTPVKRMKRYLRKNSGIGVFLNQPKNVKIFKN
jgi:hypothetical protein